MWDTCPLSPAANMPSNPCIGMVLNWVGEPWGMQFFSTLFFQDRERSCNKKVLETLKHSHSTEVSDWRGFFFLLLTGLLLQMFWTRPGNFLLRPGTEYKKPSCIKRSVGCRRRNTVRSIPEVMSIQNAGMTSNKNYLRGHSCRMTEFILRKWQNKALILQYGL